ncbi:MAG TPA: hypothetical protein VEZ49_09415 [Gemmatimonadales bacterium]|nr:hypothetical protein [Gemmatimonadales bacterium]
MPQEKHARIPQSGEALILADGRRFILTEAEHGIRGWWFTATAHDGRNTLQGNLQLQWDAQARAWRPDGARQVAAEPRAVRRAPQPQERQSD